jgi:uncharacterized radical SAM protein YgiQ
MVANYTATKKRRKSDDYTPGGINDRRPDRAVIAYANLIRRYFKPTVPIVLGGIEASLRRIAHYDFWSDSIRRSILFDAKADILVYGMAEKAVLNLAKRLSEHKSINDIRGICYIAKEKDDAYVELPSFECVSKDKKAFIEMFHVFYKNSDPITAKRLCQKHDSRYLIQNPPESILAQKEMDAIYAMDFERDVHPYYKAQGKVTALDTIQFSIPTHRGCYGECSFCSISMHEGRTVQWRSIDSIIREAKKLTKHPAFKGYVLDMCGPTANMYGFECTKKLDKGICSNKLCIYPSICPKLEVDHSQQIKLLQSIKKIEGIKKVFVASGIRYDLALHDKKHGMSYLEEVIAHHTSGQMKIAPEHTEDHVLCLMHKPDKNILLEFVDAFYRITKKFNKKQFLTYYFIAAHPGCGEPDMKRLKAFTTRYLKIAPEQVQIFTPTPSTYSSLMYYTELDPFTGKKIFVEKDTVAKQAQKDILTEK